MRKVIDGRILVETGGFSVTLNDGRSYSANHMSVAFRREYDYPSITFICSGVLMVFPLEMVASVELLKGVQHCNECDQSFQSNLAPLEGEQVEVLR